MITRKEKKVTGPDEAIELKEDGPRIAISYHKQADRFVISMGDDDLDGLSLALKTIQEIPADQAAELGNFLLKRF